MGRLAALPFFVSVIFLLLALSACSEKKSPEDEIRQYVVSAVTAIESREALAIRQIVSDKYIDDGRRDRRALTALAVGYFLRHKNIHLFAQISEIKLHAPSTEKASVKLYVAMAGRPVSGAQALFDVRADIYQFDLMLVKEGSEWLLQKARWQRASVDDFVGGGSE